VLINALPDSNRKQAFMNLMRNAMADLLKTTGADVGWNEPQSAPESERGGSG
jgi:hypothetical protein